jgi:hypothetical protein
MEQANPKSTRKKFLLWGAAALTSVGLLKFFKRSQPVKSDTVKMLTQDGTLVEIDKNLLARATKKASTKEVQQWVNKN